ncbi:MAG: TlpA family protein disulfide reductase [Dysgonamonadaceae bacterium]|jgi:thiol-disulfide isomerase/thioredoxin|nr:TlpA family protein disulfide reductase [Dysgonamonadaceae bacterium]
MERKFALILLIVANIPFVSILADKFIPRFVIDKIISENQITPLKNQKLLIIDVWATWCRPCVTSTQQMEIIQKMRAGDVFVVSVSDERTETIKKYLETTPIRLAVLQDNNQNGVIHALNIQSRPYALMLNANGEILFQGHPSEITLKMIDRQIAELETNKKLRLESVFTMPENVKTLTSKAVKGVTIQKIGEMPERVMYRENGAFYYKGKILDFFVYLLSASPFQVNLKNIENYSISISCPAAEMQAAKQNPEEFIRKYFTFEVATEKKKMDCNLLDIKNANKLWDDAQIDMGETLYPYLIGADRIEADNLTVSEIAVLLSGAKNKIYWYKGKNSLRYDWDFHYLYDNLMTEDLADNFGIVITKGTELIPVYIISNK